MSSVDVLLTVGKLDASLALLTTQDHHVIEFPTVLLPENVKAGSIIKMQVSQNLDEERKQRNHFKSIQAKILERYGTHKPDSPILKIMNVTQTSCVLAWEPLQLGSAKLKSLILYRKGIRSMVIPNPFKVTTTKISGLSVDTPYEFQLKLITTSGTLWSEKIILRTHKMTDMSGITVCLGPLDSLKEISDIQVSQCLSHIGARPLQHHVAIDTTHFVCNDLDNEENNEELIKAKHNNIPIVRPEWVRACEVEKRIVGVRGFYLDADQSILQNYTFPPINEEELNKTESEEAAAAAAANMEPEDTEGAKLVEAHNDDDHELSQTVDKEEAEDENEAEAEDEAEDENEAEAEDEAEDEAVVVQDEAVVVQDEAVVVQDSPVEDSLHTSAALENENTTETVNPSVKSLKSEPVGTPNIEENETVPSIENVEEEPNENEAQIVPEEENAEQAPATLENTNTHVEEQTTNSIVDTEEGENTQKDENNLGGTEVVQENDETVKDASKPESAEIERETLEVIDSAERVDGSANDIATPKQQEEDIGHETTPEAIAENSTIELSNEIEPTESENMVTEVHEDTNIPSEATSLNVDVSNSETSAKLEGSEDTEEQGTTEADIVVDDISPDKQPKKNNGTSNNNNKKKNKKNKKKGKKK